MKKLLWVAPLALALYACSDAETAVHEEAPVEQAEAEKTETATASSTGKYVASSATWEVDERLGEPTEDTVCAMCNMKVYTKDHEMGVFSAQAIKADGSTAFYDDIGCLLNAEFAHEEVNEKYVRDYISLNWMNVEQAYIVKTQLKSPMNWGYIFFKFEEDANTYIAESEGATLTSYTEVRQQALERRKAKIKAGQNVDAHHPEDGHVHSEDEQHGTTEQADEHM